MAMASNHKANNNRKPYNGDRRALVLAFDVGTTFSGVSYAFLDKGEVPQIHGVTRYPGQEHVTGNTKIPSILYYDRDGRLVAAGAEADNAQAAARAEDEGWVKCELFKLRLRPRRMQLDMNGMRLAPLPPGKSSEDVFGDFLAYLFACTRKFIEDTHANGQMLWNAVCHDIHFVLSHPNGWEGAQQSRMRRSAIKGGLIPNTDEGKARIRFVTEGEASMHACILSGLAHDVLMSGNGFIIADAGGGTLDVSSYILRGTHPLQIEEVAPPDCVFSGAVFVSRRCRVFLAEKLKNSKYGTDDSIDHITRRFDETTKRLFRDKREVQYVPFGSPLDKDSTVGIRSGQLRLAGAEVAELFEPSIQAAVHSIRKQVEMSRGAVKAVWLVGGFAASPWLFSQLTVRLSPLGVTVNRPDSQTSKAVADGAIGFFCDHHVSARMARYMYGVEYLREIDVNDQDHVTRSGRQLQLPSGPKYLPDAFDCILAKHTRVKESSVFSRKYYTEVTKLSTLSVFEIEIWCYRGPGDIIPKWIDRNSDYFGSLCFVRADLSRLSNSAEPKRGANSQSYWTVVFSIEIHFGLTEFKARMKWNEDGKTRYGPATIVFNEKGVRSDEDDAFSALGGVDSTPASPSRPYGSLVSREPSMRGGRPKDRSKDMGLGSELHPSAHAPSGSASSMHRTDSARTESTDADTIMRDHAPSHHTASVAGSVRSKAMSSRRGSGSITSGPSLQEVPPPVEERGPSPPALHSRAPSIAAPQLSSRQPSAAPLPSRPPSMVSPAHSRTPSAIGAPPMSFHSRAPSTARAPSIVPSRAASTREREPSPPHSRVPTIVPSRAPSLAPEGIIAPSMAMSSHSRTPSLAPAPVASRSPSTLSVNAGGRPSISRNPSTASRVPASPSPLAASIVPTVTRQSSKSYHPSHSHAASYVQDTEEDSTGDEFVDVPEDRQIEVEDGLVDVGGMPGGLDAGRQKTRSISPAPPAPAEPEYFPEQEIPLPSSKATSRKTHSRAPSAVPEPAALPSATPSVARSSKSTASAKKSGGWFSGWAGGAEEKQEEEGQGFIPPHPDTGTTAADFWNAATQPIEPSASEPPVEERVPTPKAPTPELEPEPEPEPIAKSISVATSKANKKDKKKGKAAQKAEEEARRREEEENERKRQEEEAAAAEAEAEHARIAEEKAAEAEAERQKQEEEAALEAEQRAIEEEEKQLLAEQERFNQAEAERFRREEEAAERQRLADEAAAAEDARRIAEEAQAQAHIQAQAQAKAEAEAEAQAEAQAEAKAVQEAADAKAAEEAAAASAAEAEAAATGDADAAGDAEDEEFAKLESEVKKAEEEVEKAQGELNKAEAALAKIPAPKAKGKNKKPAATPAQKAAERTVTEAEGKVKRAKEKLEKAEKALEEHVPAERPPPAPPSKAVSAIALPLKAPSTAAAGGPPSKAPSVVPVSKQPSLFDAPPAFQTGGEDDFYSEQLAPPPITKNKKKSLLDDVDMGSSGDGSDSAGDNLGLWSGGGRGGGGGPGGWGGFGSALERSKDTGSALQKSSDTGGGGGWGFSTLLDKGKSGGWGF